MNHVILLVDDDQAIIDGLKRSLRKEKYAIIHAQNGEQAKKLLATSKVDLIVSDERMPGISGTELLAFAREHYPDAMRIMLAGQPSLDVALNAINKGEIFRLFTKPCNEIDLALGIRDALRQRELVAQSRRLLVVAQEQQKRLRSAQSHDDSLRRGQAGVISIPEDSEDLDAVLREVEAELDRL